MKSHPQGLSEVGRNLLWSAATGGGILALYAFTNRFLGDRSGLSFATFLEGGIPFMPWMIVLYVLGYPAVLFPAVVLRNRKLLLRVLTGFMLCAVIALPFYLWLPVRVPRPGIPTQENFFYWSVALQYILDRPGNAFPGLYLSQVLLAVLCCFPLAPRVGWWAAGVAAVIAFASLVLRQHFFANIAAAGIIAVAVYFFWVRPVLTRALAAKEKNLCHPAGFAWRYVFLCGALFFVSLLLFKAGLRFNPVLPVN